MQIFLSYASEDKQSAEQIQLALVGEEHRVFFDAQSLPPGDDYRTRIRDAVCRSECLLFLISPDSVTQGRYTLTELGYAQEKWPHPKGKVIPIVVRKTNRDSIPPYLRAVTMLEPKGDLAAEVVSAVTKLYVSQAVTEMSEHSFRERNTEVLDAVAEPRTLRYWKYTLLVLIGLVGGVLTTILGAHWFTPELLRLDVFFPTKEVQILDDFVFVHFQVYQERATGKPVETYQSPYASSQADVFDKATYVEHVWLRKTNGDYTIRLTTSGTAPEIKSISPRTKEPRFEETTSGNRIMTADLDLEQSPEFKFSGRTPNPKTVYVYRNGFQDRNSFGGKNVAYATDRLTFVYDFSSLNGWRNLFQAAPKACLKKLQEDRPTDLELKWENGVAIVEVFTLKKGDKVRIFWTWNRLTPGTPQYSPVSCDDALR